jgi:acyl dehydratase
MANLEVSVAELKAMGPTDLGSTAPYRIEQNRIDTFADATDDHQWIHVDPERSRSGPFVSTIAHGYLTLSLVPRFLTDLLLITDQARGTNYGIEKVRFPDVVPVGAELVTSGRLVESMERADGGVQFKVAVEVRAVGAERPCLVGEMIYLAYDS